MSNLFEIIRNISDNIANQYSLDVGLFLSIYLLSFIPFYGGYLMIIYGSTRNLQLKDVFTFKIRNKLHWGGLSRLGLVVHIFGRILPYAYILIFGRNFPYWFYVMAIILIAVLTFYFIKHISISGKRELGDITIIKTTSVESSTDISRLWDIYYYTFEKVNKMSPCRQSLDKVHFEESMRDETVTKYLIDKNGVGYIGIAIITNDFRHTPWISEEYFMEVYPKEHENKMIYYFMGLAIDGNYRGNKYSIKLIEYIIDDIPRAAILGFDHSRNINPILHFFTKIVRQARFISSEHIDRQLYHVVRRK